MGVSRKNRAGFDLSEESARPPRDRGNARLGGGRTLCDQKIPKRLFRRDLADRAFVIAASANGAINL